MAFAWLSVRSYVHFKRTEWCVSFLTERTFEWFRCLIVWTCCAMELHMLCEAGMCWIWFCAIATFIAWHHWIFGTIYSATGSSIVVHWFWWCMHHIVLIFNDWASWCRWHWTTRWCRSAQWIQWTVTVCWRHMTAMMIFINNMMLSTHIGCITMIWFAHVLMWF